MDTVKKIFKWVTIGFFSLVILIVAIAFLFGEEETTTEVMEQSTLGTFTIDGDDSLFDGYSDERIEIWNSESPDTLSDARTLIKKLDRGTEVELLQRDSDDWYCKVKHGSDIGWLACEWLK